MYATMLSLVAWTLVDADLMNMQSAERWHGKRPDIPNMVHTLVAARHPQPSCSQTAYSRNRSVPAELVIRLCPDKRQSDVPRVLKLAVN